MQVVLRAGVRPAKPIEKLGKQVGRGYPERTSDRRDYARGMHSVLPDRSSSAWRLFGAVLLASTLACGASSTVVEDGAPSDTCEGYRVADACMNEDNFRECREAAARCPGEVQVLESCPLQFRCP